MLERFKRTGSDRNPSGAVATSEQAHDEDTRTADGVEEQGTSGASTDVTRPIGQTAAHGDTETRAEDRQAAEREARRRERESRRLGRTQRQNGDAAQTAVHDEGTTGATAVRDDATTGATAVRDDATTGATAVRDDGTTGDTAMRDDGAPGGTAAVEDGETARPARRSMLTGDALKMARARQRDEFGGLNWGSSFFGWLVAVGVAAIITGLLAATGAAIGLTTQDASVDSIGLGGGIALLAALMLAYFCGGYVAGRMSRFDGARQGAGVWVIAFVVTVVLGLLAAIAGDKYNVLAPLNLPSIPVGSSELRSGGWIALAAVIVGTFLAAVVGGKWGERYHRRVDRAGFVD